MVQLFLWMFNVKMSILNDRNIKNRGNKVRYMTITINYYPKQNEKFAIGLGQDVGKIRTIINVLQIFIPDSLVQKDILNRFQWRLNDDELREKFTNILQETNVSPTVKDLTAEYPKEVGVPATMYAKSILGVLLDGQQDAKTTDGRKILDSDENPIKVPMRSWPMRNFIGMMVGMGLLDWDRTTGQVTITESGKELALVDHGVGEDLSDAEIRALTKIYMSYPYTVGFLKALNANPTSSFTKFELGEHFGFANEAGFTSYGQQLFIESLVDAYESGDKILVKKIKSNWESSAEKYIRGLGSMLEKIGLVKTDQRQIAYSTPDDKTATFAIQTYRITGMGKQALGMAVGKSSHARTTKIMRWDMLATKGEVVYIRTVRALILKFLSENRELSAEKIATLINEHKINEHNVLAGDVVTADEINDHISGINSIGIEIVQTSRKKYVLKDTLTSFEIPVNGDDLPQKSVVMKEQDVLRPLLHHVPHRYLQLVELALDSSKNEQYAHFEMLTMELLIEQLNFNGLTMGGANKPDGVAWDEYGNLVIVDTKAYDNGYNLSGNTDKVWRYIDDIRKRNANMSIPWWKNVPENVIVDNNSAFVYVSGFFSGKYMELLNDLRQRTETRGGLLEVTKLLLTAEIYLKNNQYDHTKLLDNWTDDFVSKPEYFDSLIEQI